MQVKSVEVNLPHYLMTDEGKESTLIKDQTPKGGLLSDQIDEELLKALTEWLDVPEQVL